MCALVSDVDVWRALEKASEHPYPKGTGHAAEYRAWIGQIADALNEIIAEKQCIKPNA